ncbi:protein-disulfide isomerase [Shewanella maritima]|uniref:protein-disulfide isomerase n=1 Tax=Shewanella maritima TaxID=2520507 RepID=UPI0037355C52
MSTELYFIYDSHCPWSYATTQVVNALHQAFPKMTLNLLHCAHYIGKDGASAEQVSAVTDNSDVPVSKGYISAISQAKDSIKTANFMSWLQDKQPEKQLDVLNALQHAHFVDGNPLNDKRDFKSIIERFKLSPSNKVFKAELSIDAEQALNDICEIQQIIGTQHFPALIMVVDDNAIFIDHSQHLSHPKSVVEAVKQEIAALK